MLFNWQAEFKNTREKSKEFKEYQRKKQRGTEKASQAKHT
jgi:hypothetical protein